MSMRESGAGFEQNRARAGLGTEVAVRGRIKEQLRVRSDYQPVAAPVYERVEGLRRQAYDSSDYLEGLEAFAQRRQPIFRGA